MNADDEAPIAVIEEIADGIVERLRGGDVCNEVYAEHHPLHVHVFVGGHPADGFSEEEGRRIADGLDASVRPFGWFVAKCHFDEHEAEDADKHPDEEPQLMCFIDVFPLHGPLHDAGHTLHHVAPASARASILARGLRPTTGGNDHIVTANGRIYAATDPSVVAAIEADFEKLRRWSALDVWEIDATAIPGHVWRVDVEMADMGAWTADAIPPHALTRVIEVAAGMFVPASDLEKAA